MLQTDVEELRARLEEKNRMIEKKSQNSLQGVQERNRLTTELQEMKDHMEIKDRKINVLQRKVCIKICFENTCFPENSSRLLRFERLWSHHRFYLYTPVKFRFLPEVFRSRISQKLRTITKILSAR